MAAGDAAIFCLNIPWLCVTSYTPHITLEFQEGVSFRSDFSFPFLNTIHTSVLGSGALYPFRSVPKFRSIDSINRQAPGDGEGQASLACCCPWDLEESDMTEWWNNITIPAGQCAFWFASLLFPVLQQQSSWLDSLSASLGPRKLNPNTQRIRGWPVKELNVTLGMAGPSRRTTKAQSRRKHSSYREINCKGPGLLTPIDREPYFRVSFPFLSFLSLQNMLV